MSRGMSNRRQSLLQRRRSSLSAATAAAVAASAVTQEEAPAQEDAVMNELEQTFQEVSMAWEAEKRRSSMGISKLLPAVVASPAQEVVAPADTPTATATTAAAVENATVSAPVASSLAAIEAEMEKRLANAKAKGGEFLCCFVFFLIVFFFWFVQRISHNPLRRRGRSCQSS